MPLTNGSHLGPYEILAAIGAGGMGEVYRARDTRLDRTVAIKILPETLAADPQFRERFDCEARTISQLDHPHICALYDVGEQHGTAYLVMQYLEGETLADRLARSEDRPLPDIGRGRPSGRPVPVDEALTIAIQIASALDKAHRARRRPSRSEARQHLPMLAGPHPRSPAPDRLRGWREPRALC